MFKRIAGILLSVLLCCSICGCGAKGPSGKKDTQQEIKVGVLLPDGGNFGMTNAVMLGVQHAAETKALPKPLCIYNVTDVSFDESEPVTVPATETETETTAAVEPESFTLESGEVVVRAVPIPQEAPVRAIGSVAQLLEDKCNVIVAGDPIYDDLTASLAARYPDVIFLQYRGTHSDIKNLQSFTENASEAFYLAGVAAGCEGVKQIGFTARTGDSTEKEWINAFACGVADNNGDAGITVRFIGTDLDLALERTVPQKLVKEDKCGLLAQSVYTALPVSVAASQKKALPSIGFGYDMQADGGSSYLCSVVLDFAVYFEQVFTVLSDGKFKASPYIGGLADGMVTLSELQNAADKTVQTVQKETQAVSAGSRDVFGGFQPAENGYAPNVTLR